MADPARLLELSLQQVASIGLALLDPAGTIVAWRAGAERIFGYSAEEVLGRNISMLFVPEDLARGLDVWERETADKSGTAEDDRWHMRKDRGRIWVSGTLTPLRDEQGALLGYAKLMRERTDQKEQVESLEATVAMLERGQGQHVQFVTTLAHELRNPLAAIGSAVGFLDQAHGAAPDVRFATTVIRRQADFMDRLINDLVELARSHVGKVQLRRERIELQKLLNQSLEGCRSAIDQRAHLVQLLFPESPIEVDGDSVRLQQVFVNLLENAAKYTPPAGRIWVKVTTEGEDAVVQVRDTGVGISAELMPHIFDLFTQGDASARAQRGLGIGLALVKETVALHGGSVQATSDGVGKGSQFTVRLPLAGDAGRLEPGKA